MDEIAVSKFKATCLSALDRVRRTGRPLRVTRFGKPLADVVPAGPPARAASWLGVMSDRGRIAGDITGPVEPHEAWWAAGDRRGGPPGVGERATIPALPDWRWT